MKSTGTMIVQLFALVGRPDLSDQEVGVVVHLYDLTWQGRFPLALSVAQEDVIRRMHAAHFRNAEAA